MPLGGWFRYFFLSNFSWLVQEHYLGSKKPILVYFSRKNLTSVYCTVYFKSKNLTSVFSTVFFSKPKYWSNNSVIGLYRRARHMTGAMWQVTFTKWHMNIFWNSIFSVNGTSPRDSLSLVCFFSYFQFFVFSLKAQAHAQGLSFLCRALKARVGSRTFFRMELGSGSVDWRSKIWAGLGLSSEWNIESEPASGSARTQQIWLNIACPPPTSSTT